MYRRSSRQGGAKGGEPVAGKTLREVAQVEARDIVDWVSRLVAEGDVRRITLRQGDRVLLDLPLRRGVAAGVATAVLDRTAAVAGIAGRVARCTIEVERAGDAPVEDEPPLYAHIVQ
jgi:hypothetical protein